MHVEIKENRMVITIDLEKSPRPSKTGKTKVVATTGGFKISDAEIFGQKIAVSVNATIAA